GAKGTENKRVAGPAGQETGHETGDIGAEHAAPDWSHGLRQLYDSVVEEDLPDSFRALLDKLDETDPGDIDEDGATHDKTPSTGGGAPSSKGDGA
ncbi:MAG: NepR family anti-sigma factor, partial [Erythrobacter sp.]